MNKQDSLSLIKQSVERTVNLEGAYMTLTMLTGLFIMICLIACVPLSAYTDPAIPVWLGLLGVLMAIRLSFIWHKAITKKLSDAFDSIFTSLSKYEPVNIDSYKTLQHQLATQRQANFAMHLKIWIKEEENFGRHEGSLLILN